jgi:Mg2+-importing ATPase
LSEYWNASPDELLIKLQTSREGMSTTAVQERLLQFGFNQLKPKRSMGFITMLSGQFKSPIILILIFAALLSFFLHDRTDAIIIIIIVLISGLLGFWQERGATNAVKKLLAMVEIKATVIRDGRITELAADQTVPGDIVVLSAGEMVPGDCRLLEAKDLYANEATLTGETYPVEKMAAELAIDTPLPQRTNCLFMGTNIISGNGKAVVVKTGKSTEFGKISEELKLRSPETDFERGIRKFGNLLVEITLLLTILIFAFNVYLHRPIMDSFLFAMALAVGLTPQLLPAIISINLAHGAKGMAEKNVIVKRLASIENFGSLNVLCSDKTGTLTEGQVRIHSTLDLNEQESVKTLFYAYLNASFETGFSNPIDQAIRAHHSFDITMYQKADEVPYDFIRKRLSILVKGEDKFIMISKGSFQNIIEICNFVEDAQGKLYDISAWSERLRQQYYTLSAKGLRVLGLAYKDKDVRLPISKADEKDMVFLGLLVLYDPPKAGIIKTIEQLQQLGIELKIITGDNHLIAKNLGQQIGLENSTILTGPELRQLSDEALIRRVNQVNIFAEVEPNQKERVIIALKKAGRTVGYLGDGINDASALHAADVGISVDSAVDVAKEAADIVLLKSGLEVLVAGVQEGRKTFFNTLKYIFMATSANFGNMFSMAGASIFLPFLPLLPKQILLTNLMTDFPEMVIATDTVDTDLLKKPGRWDIRFIRNFMATFGLLSSLFDYIAFAVFLLILHCTAEQFRTAWFMESVISAALVVLVIRSHKPFYKSKPGNLLQAATFFIILVILILPFTPLGALLGFVPLPPVYTGVIGAIVISYIISAEITKWLFYRQKL